jgi:hypothetical protein
MAMMECISNQQKNNSLWFSDPLSTGKRERVGVYLLIPFTGCDLPTGHAGRRYEAA